MPSVTLTGELISCVENPYDFIDDRGQRVQGVKRTVWVAQAPDEAPESVQFKGDANADSFEAIAKLKRGKVISLRVQVGRYGSTFQAFAEPLPNAA